MQVMMGDMAREKREIESERERKRREREIARAGDGGAFMDRTEIRATGRIADYGLPEPMARKRRPNATGRCEVRKGGPSGRRRQYYRTAGTRCG